MIVVVPADTLFTTPVVDPIVATPVLLLLHVPDPPPAVSLSVDVPPMHMPRVPVMTPALQLTVMKTVSLPVT